MMSQWEDKSNEQWRKAFERASETPPPSIWDAIEKHLDETEKQLPLVPWWRKAAVWYAAASFLLLATVGTLFLSRNSTTFSRQGDTAATIGQPDKATATRSQPANTPALTETTVGSPATLPETTASNTETGAAPARMPDFPKATAKPSEQLAYQTRPAPSPAPGLKTDFAAATAEPEESGLSPARQELALLSPPAFREKPVYIQKRYVFFNPHPEDDEPAFPAPELNKNAYWAAVSLMPASFNPNMKFQPGPVYQMDMNMTNSYASMSSPNTQSSTGSRSRLSYALATQGGVTLSRHWSIETGVTYLQGNSSYRSNGFFVDLATNESADLLANALLAGNSNYSEKAADNVMLSPNKNAMGPVYIAMDKDVSNSYQYLQVPAYVGYTINPDKKLNYTLLGGGIANLFLKNELETTSGYTLTTKPENQVYNTLSWSAATGLRVSYKLSGQWNANLTGSYQQSLMTSFKDNDYLKAYPRMYGISWGVRYTF